MIAEINELFLHLKRGMIEGLRRELKLQQEIERKARLRASEITQDIMDLRRELGE